MFRTLSFRLASKGFKNGTLLCLTLGMYAVAASSRKNWNPKPGDRIWIRSGWQNRVVDNGHNPKEMFMEYDKTDPKEITITELYATVYKNNTTEKFVTVHVRVPVKPKLEHCNLMTIDLKYDNEPFEVCYKRFWNSQKQNEPDLPKGWTSAMLNGKTLYYLKDEPFTEHSVPERRVSEIELLWRAPAFPMLAEGSTQPEPPRINADGNEEAGTGNPPSATWIRPTKPTPDPGQHGKIKTVSRRRLVPTTPFHKLDEEIQVANVTD